MEIVLVEEEKSVKAESDSGSSTKLVRLNRRQQARKATLAARK